MLARGQREARRGEPVAEMRGVMGEVRAQRPAFGDEVERLDRRRRDRRGERIGEEIGPCALAQQIDARLGSGDIAAGRAAERLAERAR